MNYQDQQQAGISQKTDVSQSFACFFLSTNNLGI